jgi:hypothetical protein
MRSSRRRLERVTVVNEAGANIPGGTSVARANLRPMRLCEGAHTSVVMSARATRSFQASISLPQRDLRLENLTFLSPARETKDSASPEIHHPSHRCPERGIPKRACPASVFWLPDGKRQERGMSDDKSQEGERVGYKNPPKEHRFKKGHKGRPRGKARDTKTFMEMVAELLDKPVASNDNEKPTYSQGSVGKAILLAGLQG